MIGKLKEIELRTVWKHEAMDFTKWLAEAENIAELNEILGLTLTDIIVEQTVGNLFCDIYATDELTGVKVVIENQLEQSNHDHLGKIITYASGLNAGVIVWIVKKARAEHRSAIEWLNNNTGNDINFFLLEVHAYKINDSLPAAKFEIIEQPNDFIKNYKSLLPTSENKSSSEILAFWSEFNDLISERGNIISKRKATTRRWYDVSIGSSKSHLTMELVNRENYVRLGLYITNDKEWFDKLYLHKEKIEQEIGFKLDWKRDCSEIVSRVSYNLKGLNYENKENYSDLMNQMIDIILKMKMVFKKYM